MADVIELVGVSRSYRRGSEVVRAVDRVSAVFPAGRVTLIVGPSGSGKTTLISLLAGFERPDAGTVRWRGEDLDPATLPWTDLAVVPQRLGLLPELTVSENVSLADRVAGKTGDTGRVLAALALGRLGDAFPAELSIGQQQRVAVARAVAASPMALLADEPTSSQDEASARAVFSLLAEQAGAGSACIIAGHDPVAPDYADVVITMRDGRISDARQS